MPEQFRHHISKELILMGLSEAELTGLSFFQQTDTIVPIEQGVSQPCFKVQSNNNAYFVKNIKPNQQSETSNVNTELMAAQKASDVGLAPQVKFANEDWLITEYIEAKNLANCQFNGHQKSLCAINLLTKFHQLPLLLPILDIQQVIHQLLSHSTVSLDDKAELYLIAASLHNSIEVNPTTACHGDLNFSNVLFNQRAWLVDYECSCLADIEYDLAMFIAVNHLSTKQIPFICQLYQQKSESAYLPNQDKIHEYLAFCYLVNGLWYIIKHHTQGTELLKQLAAQQFHLFDQLNRSTFQTRTLMR